MKFEMALVQGSTGGRDDVFTTHTPVKLTVTGENPPQGTITVMLWELDPPSTPGAIDTNEPTRRDLIVAIQGTVVARAGTKSGFGFQPLPTHAWPQVPAGPRTFELEIEGIAGRHRVAIPPDAGEDQADLYGAAWKVMIRVVRGTPPTGPTIPPIVDDKPDIDRIFDSQGWVLLRDFRNFNGDDRPVVAIVAVPTSGDGYGNAALQFWRDHADVLDTIVSLEEILRFLRADQTWGSPSTNPPKAGYVKRDWALGPWGEVNIIAHGWLNAWNVALFQQPAEDAFFNHPSVEWIGRYELEAALDRYDALRSNEPYCLRPPEEHLLDAASRVVIRGCVLGRDAELSRVVHRAFGRRAPVYVGLLLGGYHTVGAQSGADAYECWVHIRAPGTPRPPEAVIIDTFIRKYDRISTDSTHPDFDRDAYTRRRDAWRRRVADQAALLARRDDHLDRDGPRVLTFDLRLGDHPVGTVQLANKSQAEREQAVLAAWPRMFEREKSSDRHENLRETSYADWNWARVWEVDEAAGKYVIGANVTAVLLTPTYRDYTQPNQTARAVRHDDPLQYRRVP